MIRRIELRRDVPGDLHAIVVYLEQHSILVADRFVDAVFTAFDDPAVMPGKGSPKHFRSRRREGVRSWSVPGFRNFLILYRALPEAVDVLAVTHGARNLRSLLLQRAIRPLE
jgi:toxin ParE1/3/4